jgi:hypothetical protein
VSYSPAFELMRKQALMQFANIKLIYRSVRGSVNAAAAVIFLDMVFFGSIVTAYLACPIWILVSLLRSVVHRPGWGLALARLLIPALIFWLVKTNSRFQLSLAEANGQRVVAACEKYRDDKGRFPKKLNDLVPAYMSSVPFAKYCLGPGCGFFYGAPANGNPILAWEIGAPGFRRIYNFGTRRWGYLD